MRSVTAFFLLRLFYTASGQQVGQLTPEFQPALTYKTCSIVSGLCTNVGANVTLDASYRWAHSVGGWDECLGTDTVDPTDDTTWDPTLCPDPVTCAANCAVEGVQYGPTYGITTSANALTLKFVTGTNVGSRVFLLKNDTTYQTFHPFNQEIAFTVDVSALPCGVAAALYFVGMPSDGGASYPGNAAGAKYGTGYCDAECSHSVKWVDGQVRGILST